MNVRTVPAAGVPTGPIDIIRTFSLAAGQPALFIKRFAAYTGLRYCYPMWSGRSAMYIVLKALRSMYPDRPEVLMPALTCESVYYAVIRAGLKPVLYDIDSETLGTPQHGAVDKISGATLCLVCSTLFGTAVNAAAVCTAAHERGTLVLEDVAQSFGARWDGRLLGTFGDVGVFSFGKSKNITTIHGGMVATANSEIAAAVRREHGALPAPSPTEHLGILALLTVNSIIIRPFFFNLLTLLRIPFVDSSFSVEFKVKQMGCFQAALGTGMLKKLDELNSKRYTNATALFKRIVNHGARYTVPLRPYEGCVYLRFPLVMMNADEVSASVKALKRAGIWAGAQAYRPLYALTGETGAEYPITADIFSRVLVLPTHPYMSKKDIDKTLKALTFE